jgi:hypothetical protein
LLVELTFIPTQTLLSKKLTVQPRLKIKWARGR